MSIQQYGKQFPVLLRMQNPRGHVELLETIGKGNYGYVYKGKLLKKNSELAAIKVVFPKEDEIKETLLEMEILQSCSHVHITKYFGCFLKGLDLWIAMEFCGAGSVDSIYRTLKRPVQEDAIASMIYESLLALEYLHTKVALIHRDIKAGNLLLTVDGVIKLADFGVSAQLQTLHGRANTFIGTPYWMAPEVIACDPDSKTASQASYSDKSDIWSIGITAIEIAEKNPPLSDIHPMQALKLIAKSDIGFSKPKNFSKGFVEFVMSCLDKDPDTRPSATDCLAHPFMDNARMLPRSQILADLVAKVARLKEKKKQGLEVTELDEDDAPVDPESKANTGSTVVNTSPIIPQQQSLKNTLSKIMPQKPSASLQRPAANVVPPELASPSFSDFPTVINHVSEGVQTPVFEPVSLTTLNVENCSADFLDGQYILLGTEKGLFFLDITKPNQKTPSALIHEVKFTQIQVLQEYNVLIALSGRHSHIRQYSLAAIRKLILFVEGNEALLVQNTDTSCPLQDIRFGEDLVKGYMPDAPKYSVMDEASLVSLWTSEFIKIPDTRDLKQFLVEETESSAFLTIVFYQGITLFRWAIEPYSKFMKVKSFWVPETPQFVSFGQDGVTCTDLFIGYTSELNRVSISDSKVSELRVHKEMKNKVMTKPRWRSVRQIPYSDAKLELLLKETQRGTTSRKFAALAGPTLKRSNVANDRYFLGTFDRLTKVVDETVTPMVGAGVGGWKDGVMWSEPPQVQILRPLQHVISIGKENIEIVEWKSAGLRQRLSLDNTAAGACFKVLSSRHGLTLIAVEKKKKGLMIYWMRESTPPPRPAGLLMKKIVDMNMPRQEYIPGENNVANLEAQFDDLEGPGGYGNDASSQRSRSPEPHEQLVIPVETKRATTPIQSRGASLKENRETRSVAPVSVTSAFSDRDQYRSTKPMENSPESPSEFFFDSTQDGAPVPEDYELGNRKTVIDPNTRKTSNGSVHHIENRKLSQDLISPSNSNGNVGGMRKGSADSQQSQRYYQQQPQHIQDPRYQQQPQIYRPIDPRDPRFRPDPRADPRFYQNAGRPVPSQGYFLPGTVGRPGVAPGRPVAYRPGIPVGYRPGYRPGPPPEGYRPGPIPEGYRPGPPPEGYRQGPPEGYRPGPVPGYYRPLPFPPSDPRYRPAYFPAPGGQVQVDRYGNPIRPTPRPSE